MLISGILAGFRLEKFRFSIFKISRKLIFLGRVSKVLEGCRALRRDPALPVAEAMAEAPGPCSAKEAAAGPPGRGARGPGWCASVPMLSAGATWERLSLLLPLKMLHSLSATPTIHRRPGKVGDSFCGVWQAPGLQAAGLSQLRPATGARPLQPSPGTCVVRLSGHS